MSVITSVVVVTGFDEDEAVATVNRWLEENDFRKQQLAEISLDGAGGWKVAAVRLYAAGFNHLDLYGFLDAFRAAPWEYPEDVIAYVDHDAEDTFAVSPAEAGEWRPGKQPDRHEALRRSACEAHAEGQITAAELADRMSRIAFMERQDREA